ncbi:MAG TPA: vitamin K epoxide reductase family protein [Armatimonadota bacterium]|nr:vitamin K epoxide reductase family protein [Armatimonadota bacterium]
MLERLIGGLLLLLGGGGLALAVYFVLVYYRLVQPDSGMLPRICRLGSGTCQSAVFSRYGRIFGPPNSILAIPFYLLVLHAAFSLLLTGRYPWAGYLLAASVATIVLGLYLIYALRVKLRTTCHL